MNYTKYSDKRKKRRLYGRRQGRPLNPSRTRVIEKILPQLSLPGELITEEENLDPDLLFPAPSNPVWFEIGFGNGEHLAALMRANPGNNYIGAEPFINGMAAFLKDIAKDPKDNIRVWMEDAITVINSLKVGTLDGIYILNPDPWPKKKHHKRRIVSPKNLDRFARVLKPGGWLIMTTDVDDLAEWMLTHTFRHPSFEWTAENRMDWTSSPPGWIETRYEQKGRRQERRQTYLIFRRL
jgi:tRNA (guanine-N7-)-methyltransferase